MNLVGYAYDADHHCEDCTIKYARKQMVHKHAEDASVLNAIERGAIVDSENNPIHPMFDTEETDYPVHCSDCGEYMDTAWTDVSVEYVYDALRDYLVTNSGTPAVLDIWAAELSLAVPSHEIEVTLSIYEDRRKYELGRSSESS